MQPSTPLPVRKNTMVAYNHQLTGNIQKKTLDFKIYAMYIKLRKVIDFSQEVTK